MLQITEAAMDVLKRVRADSDAPDESAARFQLNAAEGEQTIGFAFSNERVEGDQKVADDGEFQVYVAPELATPLGDAVVDATPTDRGTELVLREQESPEQQDGQAPAG